MTEVSQDALWNGRIPLLQPARGHGYRFNLDPVLLAGFAPHAEHVLDLGAGVGTIGILLLKSGKAQRVTAVEVQPELAQLAERNAHANDLATRMTVLQGDVRKLVLPEVDAVVTNPPYFRLDEGHASPHEGRDAGRRERFGTLAELLAAALPCLRPSGVFAGIVPWARATELSRLLIDHGLTQHRRREVIPRAGQPPGHMLLEARRGARTVQDAPALIVHAEQGFTPEVAGWVTGS